MFGSLNKIWPWKQTLSTFIDSHEPLTQKNILPSTYEAANGDPQLALAITFALTGFVLIFAIEFISKLTAAPKAQN
jgi:putative membrane protein